MSYLLAAYAVVFFTLGAYALRLQQRRRELREAPVSPGPRPPERRP